ncbi:hypothetical protein, partial [Pseudomonas viridiflava]|uniref:hypothetical protein n=1 Tax=Pseudomonas viridiflava TaxID=33069 RepID=UPI001F41A094
VQHSLLIALRCVLYAVSGAHSMDGLRGRQPHSENLLKSTTSTLFRGPTDGLQMRTYNRSDVANSDGHIYAQ